MRQVEDCDICHERYERGEGYLNHVPYGDGFVLMVCMGDKHTKAEIQEEIDRTIAAAARLFFEREKEIKRNNNG